jgi:hypothetical protein
MNEEALAHWGLARQKQKKLELIYVQLIINVKQGIHRL